MTREEKIAVVDQLAERLNGAVYFYIADSSELDVATINSLRAAAFEKGVELQVVKNTLIKKALERLENPERYEDLYSSLKGPSTIMFTEVSNAPAKVMKDFRKDNEKPLLKAAYIDSDVFVGDENLDTLAALKSKEELVGDIVLLLQSPMKNVVGALSSGGSTIAGLVKTLQERAEA
jgi:large subunit ribosomal protein L10